MSKDAGNDGYRFIALDSTAISSYSQTSEDAVYGHAKQDPELKLVNYTLGVDYFSGEVVYVYESEGSITDKTLYPNLSQLAWEHESKRLWSKQNSSDNWSGIRKSP